MINFEKNISTIGKKKTAVAKIILIKSLTNKGQLLINNLTVENFFKGFLSQTKQLIDLSGYFKDYKILIFVKGGGIMGQLVAILHGLAKLVDKCYPETRSLLKKNDLLTRDSRIKERKKYGLKKARKAPQYSKR